MEDFQLQRSKTPQASSMSCWPPWRRLVKHSCTRSPVFADDALKRDHDVPLVAVQRNGLELLKADAALEIDRVVVLAAVDQNCLATQYAAQYASANA